MSGLLHGQFVRKKRRKEKAWSERAAHNPLSKVLDSLDKKFKSKPARLSNVNFTNRYYQ